MRVGKTPQESEDVLNFIKDHCDKNGITYILGGEGVIPRSFETALQELGYIGRNIQKWGNEYEIT